MSKSWILRIRPSLAALKMDVTMCHLEDIRAQIVLDQEGLILSGYLAKRLVVVKTL